MKRYLIAAITCLALTVGVGTASADGGLVTTVVETVQSNTNTSGDATASNGNETGQSNTQSQTGSGGDATSGDATAAGSGDATSGDADGGDVTQSQTGSNENTTQQEATATSQAEQVAPVNANVPVCVALSCSSGDVEQSNENTSGDAHASNDNTTHQSNTQSQTGSGGDATSGDATAGGSECCKSGSGDATSGDADGGDVDQTQNASNSNTTSQEAKAVSKAVQVAPVNANVPVCVAFHCKSGEVHQSNSNTAGDATASNANHTKQSNTQSQQGSGGDARSGDATANGGCCGHEWKDTPKCDTHSARAWDGKSKGGCEQKPKPCGRNGTDGGNAESGDAYGGDVTQTQNASNTNRTQQTAKAKSVAKQHGPLNLNLVWTPSGKGGGNGCPTC